MLNFPNASRSYDSRQRRVRFWAHDSALEIQFFLDAAALLHLDPETQTDEAGLLRTFDLNRATIETAATRAYTRDSRGAYILMASDFA
jgi:hypothetical protein